MGEWARLFSELSRRNVDAILERLDRRRLGKGQLTAEQIGVTFPLFRFASYVSDGDLQDRWAALLDSTISEPNSMLPSFARTLSELNAAEARFLDRLKAVAQSASTEWSVGRFAGEMDYGEVIAVYDSRLREYPFNPSLVTQPEDNRDPELMAQADLAVDDLVRLGILAVRFNAITGGDHDAVDTVILKWFSLSTYGRRFMQAIKTAI